SGSATALFLAASIGPFLAARYVWGRKSDADLYDLRQRALAGMILIGVSILASGVIARPVKLAMQDWHLSWSYVLPRVLDLEHHGATIAGLDADPLRPPLILGHQGNPVSGMGPH